MGERLPQLEMVLDETLRMYPPAWIGPRRSRGAVRVRAATRVPARAYVNYSSWVSHHLPEVFPEPERFMPERFAPEQKAALPKGAYVPFGGGSRTCIGMRFGQIEIRAIATLILGRFTLELPRGVPSAHPRDADDRSPRRAAGDGARAKPRRRPAGAPRGVGREPPRRAQRRVPRVSSRVARAG